MQHTDAGEVEPVSSQEWDLIAWGIQSLTWHQQALCFTQVNMASLRWLQSQF